MSKIISIGTAVPQYKHTQEKILEFMSCAYSLTDTEARKLRFLYKQSGIKNRYSVIPDFSLTGIHRQLFLNRKHCELFPSTEQRMKIFQECAAPMSMKAIDDCLKGHRDQPVTHLITVCCTGMSAPGLDLEILELLNLPADTWRTSINFMGCYAAIHALKIADTICKTDKEANVLIVCVECCTLHFQLTNTPDNISSSLLFADGAAAVLVSGNPAREGLRIDHFYSCVAPKGKHEMAWELSSTGFLLTLSNYIPDLIREDFEAIVTTALNRTSLGKDDITHWCIHPGGKRILEAIGSSLQFSNGQLQHSYKVLNDYGNMSSPTILFVLKQIRETLNKDQPGNIFGAAFGPGLTIETFILST